MEKREKKETGWVIANRGATKTLNPIAVATNKPRHPAGLGFSVQDGFQSTHIFGQRLT
jgi:hypothetical protein